VSGPDLRPVLVATRSAGKRRELLPWFSAIGVPIETLEAAGVLRMADEDGLETHDTFEENALAKARWFHRVTGGRVVVAEDSGLEVDALEGAPGVRTKRWSGREDLDGAALDDANNAYLLERLRDAEAAGRTSRRARFVCAAACVWPGGESVVRGTSDGAITHAPEGVEGFGYDPYFFSDALQATFASVSRDAKSRVSHRARAFAALLDDLRRLGVTLGPGKSLEAGS
jgi:XTP/dITP diphosphohydrolase